MEKNNFTFEHRKASGAASASGRRGHTPIASFVSRLAAMAEHDRGASMIVPAAIPALGLAILTCMDTRLDPNRALGLNLGDAHILRNAGGRVTEDVVRSLHFSVSMMKVTEIGIVHHTGCGLHGMDNDTLADRSGLAGIDFLPFRSVDDGLMADIEAIRLRKILPAHGLVWGAVYDLGTGQIDVLAKESAHRDS
jgi:carbonic anhydrase